MNLKVPLSVFILTYNEELNIKQALNNVCDWADEVIILDSGSTDETCTIAESYGAKIVYRKFDNYARQRNFAIHEIPRKNEWMFFLDADEYLTEELKKEISDLFGNEKINEFDGYYIKRRFYFFDRWIKYGGYYPNWLLRLFKGEKANCEREINEHIKVDGKIGKLKHDFADRNQKGFSEWIIKHNSYSTFEATQFDNAPDTNASLWGSQPQRTQWIRQNIWNKMMPPLVRPFIYFFYRYFIRLGFLDGKAGFIYHFMQGLVFLLMIDIKYIENKRKTKNIPPQ